jgi:F0F1-type ATP synthase assembly protein I
MNETTSFRRIAATLTIGSFSVAALMGIIALLGGGDFGENEARVLLTTLIVGCTSICSLCYLATAGTRWGAVGALGGVVVVLPAVTALVLVWSDWGVDSDGLSEAFGIGVVLALTLAQVSLLLALAGDGRLGAVLWPTIAIATLLAVLISGMILGELDVDDLWRLMGVLGILDVLGTLVTIALAKFGGRQDRRMPASAGRTSVTLTVDQSRALDDLARRVGRSRDELIADAVARYLGAGIS